MKVEMSTAAREAQRAYNRAYYAQNRDRIQQQRAERWEKKAAEAAEKERKNEQ